MLNEKDEPAAVESFAEMVVRLRSKIYFKLSIVQNFSLDVTYFNMIQKLSSVLLLFFSVHSLSLYNGLPKISLYYVMKNSTKWYLLK